MGCLLSCHVALLSLAALDALAMFVLKSDPKVDTRLKWGTAVHTTYMTAAHSALYCNILKPYLKL